MLSVVATAETATKAVSELGWLEFAGALALLIGIISTIMGLLKYNNSRVTALANLQSDVSYIKGAVEGLQDIRNHISKVERKVDRASLCLNQHLIYQHNIQVQKEDEEE